MAGEKESAGKEAEKMAGEKAESMAEEAGIAGESGKAKAAAEKQKPSREAGKESVKEGREMAAEERGRETAAGNKDREGREMMAEGKAKEGKETVKLFGRWDTTGIKVVDIGIGKYLTLDAKVVPHSFGRLSRQEIKKSELNVVERLVNKMMRSGQGKRKLSGKYIRGRGSTGKKLQTLEIVEKALAIVEKETKENPMQVLVRAIENSSPREDTTRIQRGGISYTQAVDISPLRRIDEALKNIALAAFASSFNNKMTAEIALAKEIISAGKGEAQSYAVRRRDEIERIAKGSR